jgi:putative ABC transport system permease protein
MKSKLPIREILVTAQRALLRNWGRTVLTSLSMVVGTASFMLVVVTGISGREYTLDLIKGVGVNLIALSNESSDAIVGARALSDRLNFGDLYAIRRVPGIGSAVALLTAHPTMTEQGVTRRISLIGTTPEYQQIRNIKVVRGSFIDENDEKSRNKVCLVTDILAKRLEADPFYRGTISLYGVRFKVIGVFRERVSTFGQMEVSDNTAIIPLSVMRYFKTNDAIDFMYASAETMEDVPQASAAVMKLLVERHQNQSIFHMDILSEMLETADKIALGLMLVLLVIAAISLVASGINIMNVMLITVTERTREIGLKKSVGAYRHVLLTEFLVEALMLSSGGGLVGIALGAVVPYSVRFFTSAIRIQIPPIAVALGFGVTLLVGLTFGMIPALRAARMNPVEALRYE